jgi:transcriptional regulator with XRE-family HTH domain
VTDVSNSRRELGRFLRTRRERIPPDQVGLPAGPRRRTNGLRREEVAVLAGLSPTWYTYLEQARDIRPSPEVLDSLARVLRLTEDERRYMHVLAYGEVIHPEPLDTEVSSDELVRRTVAITNSSEYPVYAANRYTDLIAWNPAATEWYDDWSCLPEHQRNMLHWMLTSPIAESRLRDWEADTKDIIARWRRMTANLVDDHTLRQRVGDLMAVSPRFARWWNDHDVKEHRSKLRHFRHPKYGDVDFRLIVLEAPEFTPSFVVYHLPVNL